MQKKYNLIAVIGPTASGKTSFAANLALRTGSEIISADSRQVYRSMDIGTGKDYTDYIVDGKKVPCHLIDLLEPGCKYNVFEYQKDFFKVFAEIGQRGLVAILCGGTGMYIEAVTKAYKLIEVPVNGQLRDKLKNKPLNELKDILLTYKSLHNHTDTSTEKRAIRAIEIGDYYKTMPLAENKFPSVRPIFFGIKYERETIRERITSRLHNRLNNGMVEETKALLLGGIAAEDLIYYGLEYKFLTLFLSGELSYTKMVEKLNIAIHQFAKRQMTWFRKMEREGTNIYWIEGKLPMLQKLDKALEILEIK